MADQFESVRTFCNKEFKCECIKDEAKRLDCLIDLYQESLDEENEKYSNALKEAERKGEEIDIDVQGGYVRLINLYGPILRNLKIKKARL